MRHLFLPLFLLGIVLLGCKSEKRKSSELVWDQTFFQIGSQSSPRAAELNGDSTLDIVMGAGLAEIAETDHGVIALDGKTGKLLWKQSASAHIVGSATFLDITQDGTKDIFIGGRAGNLLALNGKTGEKIWTYSYTFEEDDILKFAKYNFYNSTLVPDQNNDGFEDLLIVNGGNWEAPAGEMEDRWPGVLMLFDSRTGNILAADTMPDGHESYMSPVAFQQKDSPEINIIFGTGGETASGHLYLSTLSEFMSGRLSEARVISSEMDHGFIAPPSIADINNDGVYDIISASHASTFSAINGRDYSLIWQHQFPSMECSNALAIGKFNRDQTPDILATMSKGVWPNYTISQQVMINGKNGEIEFLDSIGCFTLSSPVVYDFNGDGFEEALISKNEYDCSKTVETESENPIEPSNALIYIDFKSKQTKGIDIAKGFKNFYSTPWIGDLDQNGYLDMVYTLYFHSEEIARFLGMRIKRVSTPIPIQEGPKWGTYMGQFGTSVYPSDSISDS